MPDVVELKTDSSMHKALQNLLTININQFTQPNRNVSLHIWAHVPV